MPGFVLNVYPPINNAVHLINLLIEEGLTHHIIDNFPNESLFHEMTENIESNGTFYAQPAVLRPERYLVYIDNKNK